MTTTQQKGIIIENRFIELLTIQSDGVLTCYKPVADDDGIDLIINKRKEFKSFYVQVKSRFGLANNNRFVQDIKECNSISNSNYCFVFIYYSKDTLEIECIWIVPSCDFILESFKKVTKKESAKKSAVHSYRFTAFPKSKNKNIKWYNNRVEKSNVGKWFLDKI